MAVGSADGMVTLWETASGTPIGEPFEGPGNVSSIAFSPDGSRMAAGSTDGMVTLWETADPRSRHDAPNRHAGKVTTLAFSPDGTWLASGGQDKTIWFWNMRDGTQARTFQLKGDVGSLTSIAFSPDGTTLASGSGESSPGRRDASVTLWDVAGHSMLAAPLERGIGHVRSVAFSPDGDRLASGDAAGDITVWDVDPSSWAERLCDRANRDLTADERAVYLPGEPTSAPCP
jgi:WD40 repeat protein